MTPQEHRGRTIFLAVAAALIVEKLVSVGLALAGPQDAMDWDRAVVRPLGQAAVVAYLGYGGGVLRVLVAIWLALYGCLLLVRVGKVFRQFAELELPGEPSLFLNAAAVPLYRTAAVGVLNLAAGVVLLAVPSVRAFLRHRGAVVWARV